MQGKILNISTSPHLVKGITTADIMRNVVYALLPISAFAIYAFGLNALLILITSIVAAIITEQLLNRTSKKESTISDWSAILTGLLFGLTVPPILPIWMVFIGSAFSIAIGKYVFGGLGYNVFNPALVGRAILQAAFPVAMTTWMPAMSIDRFSHISSSVLVFPFATPIVDAVSGATPLSAFKFDGIVATTNDLGLGLISGSTGETCALLIVLGGIYLAARKMLNWRIPVVILLTVYLLSGILHLASPQNYPSPLFMLFSGGLMLGAVFMATDMVTSPMTPLAVVLFGVLIGVLVVVIRIWGGLPEGVMYAILLANAVAPHLDNLVKPRVYGTTKKVKA
ncbi:MAG: RnfABCDGE type electron transport complex subunit D [Bacteroidia bacterium]